jgi:hypothetical protein
VSAVCVAMKGEATVLGGDYAMCVRAAGCAIFEGGGFAS